MTPVLYFLSLAQRAGNTPAGQAFLRMAQNAADQVQRGPRLVGSQSAGAGSTGPFYSGFTANTVTPRLNPVGRGLAGVLGAGSVATGSSDVNPAQSLFDQLDRSSTPREPRPLTIPGGRPTEPSFEPGYEGDAGRRLSGELMAMQPQPGYDMPPAARAAVNTARTVMPQSPTPPPPRPRDEAPAPMSSRDLWQRYNDTESPADFVRADAAMRAGRAEGGGLDPMGGLMPPDMATMPVDAPEMPMPPMPADAGPPPSMDGGPKPPAAGGGAGGRDAAINKALDIIHNLVTRQRI